MALLPANLDYTDRDFDALRARARNLISSVFPDWTDDNVADVGNIIVELFCFTGDVLAKTQDNQVRETRWSQAQLRKSLLALLKLTTYVPRGASAASVDEVFTLATPAAADVVLPAGTAVLTEDVQSPTRYQLTEPLTIPAGTTEVTQAVENSVTRSDTFASTGLGSQVFTLTATPYVDNSAEVAAGNGAYTQVRNFLGSGGTDRHVTVTIDANDRATIKFGDGVNGQIPNGNITVAYKTGGGRAGRVEANRLRKLEGVYTDVLGHPVTLTVNNPVGSSGGDDRETNEQIRQNAPEQLRVSDRMAAREDFEIVAEGVPGVSRALFLTSNEDVGVDENAGILFVVPPGATTPSSTVLDAVEAAFLAKPHLNTFRVRIQGGVYVAVDVLATIYRRAGVTKAAVKASVTAALTAWFADRNADGTKNMNVDFGYYFQAADGTPTQLLALSDVFNAVRDATGVRKVGAGAGEFTLNGGRADVAIANQQFPKLGAVTLVDGDDGTVL